MLKLAIAMEQYQSLAPPADSDPLAHNPPTASVCVVIQSAVRTHFCTHGNPLFSEQTSLPVIVNEVTREVMGTVVTLPCLIPGAIIMGCGGSILELASFITDEQLEHACLTNLARVHTIGTAAVMPLSYTMGCLSGLCILPGLPRAVHQALRQNIPFNPTNPAPLEQCMR